jgi:hypothetical protein
LEDILSRFSKRFNLIKNGLRKEREKNLLIFGCDNKINEISLVEKLFYQLELDVNQINIIQGFNEFNPSSPIIVRLDNKSCVINAIKAAKNLRFHHFHF